jgi:CopG family transcriptional regulator/antitoxin EndoAI
VSRTKKIVVSIPNNLLEQVDCIISLENKNRSEFIRDAMRLYIRERENIRLIDQLKNGYVQMAEINIKFAEMGIYEDYEDFVVYEKRLSECE